MIDENRANGAIVIYPTSLALKQYQQNMAERNEFCDSRNHLSANQFISECVEAARQAGLMVDESGCALRPATDLDSELAIVKAVARFKKQSANNDCQFVLARLSETALEDVLFHLLSYVGPIANRTPEFLAVLGGDKTLPKNIDLADLYRFYDNALLEVGVASMARKNAFVLALLQGDRAQWPMSLRMAKRITFKGLRWVQPFVELLAHELVRKLGSQNVVFSHILEEHEHDWWSQELMPRVGSQMFGGQEASDEWVNFNNKETANSISKLIDLREGMAMDDPVLAQSARNKVDFSVSVGVYGEVEDLARRIVYATRHSDNPIHPQNICLTARSIGKYSDAIVDVFKRFKIPYYFRRGLPVMSVAVVNSILDLLNLSTTRTRDVFCALLESPWLNWHDVLGAKQGWIIHPSELAEAIRRSGVEPVIEDEAQLESRLKLFFRDNDSALKASSAVKAFRMALGMQSVASVELAVSDLLERCEVFGIQENIQEWADVCADETDDSVYILNASAFKAVLDLLQSLQQVSLDATCTSVSWYEVSSLVSRAIKNLTVADPESNIAGVWVLSAYDIAGLSFDTVMVAGLNSGEFPAVASQNAVFSDSDLVLLKELMGGNLPCTVLASSKAKNSQENLLFLSLMAAAKERMVFSRTSRNDSGDDVPASVYYNTLWRLVGWSTYQKDIPALPPSHYDQWRMEKVPNAFGQHWAKQKNIEPYKRSPFYGESFFSVIPPELCCATDEALQSAAAGNIFSGSVADDEGNPNIHDSILRGLKAESIRTDYFNTIAVDTENNDQRSSTEHFVGEIDIKLWEHINSNKSTETRDFSTTELQSLCVCPYKYYLGSVMKLDEVRTNELEADPIDFGTVVHEIMETAFRLLKGELPWTDCVRGASELVQKYNELCIPSWFVPQTETLMYKGRHEMQFKNGVPMVELDSANADEYVKFFQELTNLYKDEHQKGYSQWMLGAQELLDIEWKKIKRCVLDLLEGQFSAEEYCSKFFEKGEAPENIVRCTVQMEYVFDSRKYSRHKSKDAESLMFERDKLKLKVHGMVDRIDLLFDAQTEALIAVLVLDYKGSHDKYVVKDKAHAANITSGTDCQLPVYGAAAIEYVKNQGLKNMVPVIGMYLSYKSDAVAHAKAVKNGFWIRLDGNMPEDAAQIEPCENERLLLDIFADKLFECLALFESGKFMVSPVDCGYCEFAGVCRYSENLLGKQNQDDD